MNSGTVLSLQLSRNEVNVDAYIAYVYGYSLEDLTKNLDEIFHSSERRYFDTIKSEKRKFTYLSGRFAGKLAVAEYLHEDDMSRIEIRSGFFDQPLVKHLSVETPELTLSHCSDLAIAIAYQTGHIMGVDVEEIDLSKSHVFKSQLTQDEITRAEGTFEDFRMGYHLMWTAKEALSKALKCGLTVPFDILEIDEIKSSESGAYISLYKNFVQYKCCSWIMDRHILSITLPQKTDIGLDIKGDLQRASVQQTGSVRHTVT